MPVDIKQRFLQFSKDNHYNGSGASSSYLRALDIIDNALHENKVFLRADESVWNICDTERLGRLYDFINAERKKIDGGVFRHEHSPSYWQKGFCSAAVRDFVRFLVLSERQTKMTEAFQSAQDGSKLAKTLEDIKLKPSVMLLDDENIDLSSKTGKDAIQEVKVRQNQHVFRKFLLQIYRQRCCLTGLSIPQVLRASHISAWADDKKNRLNLANGLCLSATYDAAFDEHLISLDDDYRLILAPSLHDYYTDSAFREYFRKFEGKRIQMPIKFFPSKELLEKHREKMR